MLDSDRLGHGLKDLNVAWLDGNNETQDKVKAFLSDIKSNNYAECPPDIMGEYACEDVLINRRLLHYIDEHMPEEMFPLVETEIDLTAVLFDMEMHGLQINPLECKKQSLRCLHKLIDVATEIEDLSDREWTNSHQCIHDILINQYGLPILATIKERDEDGYEVDTGRTTFDKDALPLYQVHPITQADPKLKRLIDLILAYRQEQQHKSLFLDSFLDLHDAQGVIHPTYNQIVRTGRMSSRRPNAQQQNFRSKILIHPRPGMAFLAQDYSQVEYRLIVHYVKDLEAIAAYHNDPTTDFHRWVADMMHVDRSAGKTLNFGMAYGAGKKRVTTGLISNPEIIQEIGAVINEEIAAGSLSSEELNEAFQLRCATRASEVYDTYHERFPGIKRLAAEAAYIVRKRGYVKNLYKRRRHLPDKASRKAFNSVVQGGASDIAKEAMVKAAPRYNKQTRALDVRIVAQVHDEVLWEGPEEVMRDPATHKLLFELFENPRVDIRVPIITDMGFSKTSWAETDVDENIEDENGKLISGKIARS
jgi:DNA polymerase-1